MEVTREEYKQIKRYLPVGRGNVKIDNKTLINAILYMAENGCKWRGLPKEYPVIGERIDGQNKEY